MQEIVASCRPEAAICWSHNLMLPCRGFVWGQLVVFVGQRQQAFLQVCLPSGSVRRAPPSGESFHLQLPTTHPPTPRPGISAGALPDQLEFSKDCRTLLVANEGEPETYTPASLANDPEGSVSIIRLCSCGRKTTDATPSAKQSTSLRLEACPPDINCSSSKVSGSVRTATFTAWNNKREALLAQGVKLTGVNASVAQDLETECVTFSEDESLAFVSLQVRACHAVSFGVALHCMPLPASSPECGNEGCSSRREGHRRVKLSTPK